MSCWFTQCFPPSLLFLKWLPNPPSTLISKSRFISFHFLNVGSRSPSPGSFPITWSPSMERRTDSLYELTKNTHHQHSRIVSGHLAAQYQGMNGWYVYVQRFGNGFNPKDYSYVQSSEGLCNCVSSARPPLTLFLHHAQSNYRQDHSKCCKGTALTRLRSSKSSAMYVITCLQKVTSPKHNTNATPTYSDEPPNPISNWSPNRCPLTSALMVVQQSISRHDNGNDSKRKQRVRQLSLW